MIQIFTSKGTPTKRKTSISSDASTFKKTTDTPNAVTVRYTANRNASEFYSHATTKCYSTNSKFKSKLELNQNNSERIKFIKSRHELHDNDKHGEDDKH